MRPPRPELGPSTCTSSSSPPDSRPSSSVILSRGFCRIPSVKISSALVAHFDVDRRSFASLSSSK